MYECCLNVIKEHALAFEVPPLPVRYAMTRNVIITADATLRPRNPTQPIRERPMPTKLAHLV